MAKVVQSSNAVASPAMGLAQAEFTSPAHAALLEKFQTKSAKLSESFHQSSRELAEEYARELKNLAPFDEDSSCSTSSSSEHAGSDSERLEEPDDDDNDDEESLSPSADSTGPFHELGVPKPKSQVNGNPLKNSTKLESKERKKKKILTVNGISKTDTSESPAAVGLDLSQKVGGMVLSGAIVNGDGESTDRKERIRSSKLDYKRLDELYV